MYCVIMHANVRNGYCEKEQLVMEGDKTKEIWLGTW